MTKTENKNLFSFGAAKLNRRRKNGLEIIVKYLDILSIQQNTGLVIN